MGATSVDVAEAVLVDVNADPLTNFGREFVAIRSYADWDDTIEEDGIRVDVVPAPYAKPGEGFPESMLYASGTEVVHHPTTQIIVRERFRKDQNLKRFLVGDIDPNVLIVEKLAQFFVTKALSTMSSAQWISSEVTLLYSREHLRRNSQYTGLVTLVHQVIV